MSQSSKRNLYLAIIAILLLINAGAVYYMIDGKRQNDEQKEEIATLKEDYEVTLGDLKAEQARLNEMKGQNAQLDSIIALREAEIETYKGRIESLLQKNRLVGSELNEARQLIEGLERENENFMFRIDSLVSVTDSLKETLSVTTARFTDSLTTQKNRNQELEEETAYLSEKYEKGKLLQAANLYASGIIKKERRNTEKETTKLRKAEAIKVCFETGVNKVRDQGPVQLHVRIVNPKGETLYLTEQGSGEFTDDKGTTVRYTLSTTLDYTGQNESVCVSWGAQIRHEGTYEVTVYQDGYQLGETSFVLD